MRVSAAILALCLSGAAALSSLDTTMSSFPLPGEWPFYRRNGALDARSPLRGSITRPRLAWKQFVGSTERWFVGPGVQGRAHSNAPTSGTGTFDPATLTDPRWGLVGPMGEIEGRPQPLVQNSTTTYAHVLPDTPGLQKIVFESAFSKPTKNGDWAHDCVGRCYAWRQGQWVQVWETEPIDGLFSPQPLVGDFDGDGSAEIAILPWKELRVLDGRTGRVKDHCTFTDGRIYGFFGVYDLDGDGSQEFVVQADFAKHVNVLGYRNGKLTLLWRREIELDISNPQKVLRVPPEPAADVDGDGRREVLVSLYNGSGDGRWHLTAHHGMTGEVKADLPDEYLQGVVDVDGDGTSELLTMHTTGAGVPTYGTLRVWSVKGGTPILRWQGERRAWQLWNRPQPPHINSGATLSGLDVLSRRVNGRARVVLRQRLAQRAGKFRVSLQVCDWQSDGFQPVKSQAAAGNTERSLSKHITGSDIAAVAMDEEGQVLVRDVTPATGSDRPVEGVSQALGSTPRGVPAVGCAVAWERGASVPTILVAGSMGTEEIVAFRPPEQGHPAKEYWRVQGRGLGYNWPQGQMYGPVIASLFGDGRRQCLYATAAPKGYGRLVAADLNGREVWHHDFPDIPGTPPIWNTGGLVYWQVGHFTERQRQDVLVTVRRSMMHSEETALLSGRNGKQLWRRDRQKDKTYNRGVGGTPFALADFDGDSLDDVACLFPSDFYILHGRTGRNLLAKIARWPQVPGSDVYWGVPIAGDFEGIGRNSLFFGTSSRSLTGLLRGDGSLVWWDARDRATTCLPAFGDFTGSGRREVVGIGFEDGIRCYDAATGAVLWRMAAPMSGTPTETASADINGDGREEVLFTSGSTLYCVGTVVQDGKKTGGLLWKYELPATVGPPIIADVAGQGTASILLVGADGWVYCIQ